jgi:hypothetical protein
MNDTDLKTAIAYIEAWKAKVPIGTEMLVSKMKCALADGPCGCAEDSTTLKCTGPYPQCPMETILFALDCGEVENVIGIDLLAPEATVVDGHVHVVEFVGPGTAKYIKKL